jgi:outer membrane protein assembly factor BamB
VAPGFTKAQPDAWNEFRGPNGAGVAIGARPPVKIDSARATWAVDLSPGASSPVLSDRLVILTAVEGDRLVTLAFEKQTGRLAWRREAPPRPMERVHESSSPAASTPYIDGDRVYVCFGSFGLLCYRLEDGADLWARPIPTPGSKYGMTSSPIVHDKTVILVVDNEHKLPNSQLSKSKIFAFDRDTGEVVWQTLRPMHRSGWSTPTLWRHGGMTELVVLGNQRAQSYNADTGEKLWQVSGFSPETIARPLVGDGVVYVSASMLGGVSDENPDPEPFWRAVMLFDANQDQKLQPNEMTGHFTFPFRPELAPDHPGFGRPLSSDPVRRQQQLDGIFKQNDQNGDGVWTRDEFIARMSFKRAKPSLMAIRHGGTGDVTETHVAWSLHRGIPEIPSPILHGGRIYMLNDGGVLIALDAKDGRTIYRQRLGAIGHYRASPVIANGHLYIVSQNGVISVVKTGDVFKVVHRFDLKEIVAATPAIDKNTIYLRTVDRLYAFRDPGIP